MINNFKFNVELVQKKAINTPLTLVQYDRSYKVTFYLYENGQPYIIKDNEKIQIDMALPNGKAYIASMGEKGITNVKENHFDLIIGREITLGSGRGSFNVAVVDKESGITYRKGSNKYTIEIMGNSLSEDTVSSELMVTAKEELDESIEIAQDLISQSKSTENPAYTIKTTDWTTTSASGTTMYTYTLKHNLNTTNIIVQSYTSNNTNIDLPYKIVDSNNIKFTTFTKDLYKVVVSANYQAVAGTIASGIATEVQDARGEYGTLDSRLDNIDTVITTKTEALDDKITTTKSTLEKLVSDTALATKKALHPVNSIYLSMDSTNPSQLFGFGTWQLIGQGRTLVGVDTNDNDFKTVNKTGGSKTHSHDSGSLVADIGAVNNDLGTLAYNATNAVQSKYTLGVSGSAMVDIESKNVNHATSVSGTTTSNSNMPPYITCYIWKRKS